MTRDRLETPEYHLANYWATETCVFVGCRESYREPVRDRGCHRCGAGPYHQRCIELHLRWCRVPAISRR